MSSRREAARVASMAPARMPQITSFRAPLTDFSQSAVVSMLSCQAGQCLPDRERA